MKLLGWMHRKFRQNSNEPFKDFAIGNSCNCLLGQQPSLDEEQHQFYPKPSRPPHTHKHHPHKDTTILRRKSFAGLSIEEDPDIFEPDALFDGLLAIGTLGSSAASFEHVVTEKEAEVTENDLKLINEELEKVLGADAKDDNKCNDSSGRTSHVSSVTLGGRDSNAVCPLQGYLFGSPIELPETTPTAVKNNNNNNNKEHRTSLGELFQRTKMVEEMKGDKDEKPLKKTTLKRRMLRTSTNVSAAAAADSVSAETKLNKILQMFHRKVHPEKESTSSDKKGGVVVGCVGGGGGPNYKAQAQDQDQAQVQKMGSESESKSGNDGDHRVVPDEDIVIVPKGPICKQQQRIRRYNSHSFALGASDSNGNREHWIKTDADYLVLEL